MRGCAFHVPFCALSKKTGLFDLCRKCKNNYLKLKETLDNLEFALKNVEDEPGPGDLETLKTLPELENRFREALEDDFNTPKAITVFRELSRTANVYLETGKNMQVLEEIHALYKRFSDTFGIFAKAGGEEVPDEVIRLVEEREEARNIKDWKTSDAIREKIKSLGYIVQDTKEGPKIKKSEES